jgi:hypothetical protein
VSRGRDAEYTEYVAARLSSLRRLAAVRPGSKLRISQHAPDVAGHRAFWTGPGPGVAWQYARGGWALMTIPAANLSAVLHSKEDLAGKALKIAR